MNIQQMMVLGLLGGKAAARSSLLSGLQLWWQGGNLYDSAGGPDFANVNSVTFGADYATFVTANKKRLNGGTSAAREFPNADFTLSWFMYIDPLADTDFLISKIGAAYEMMVYYTYNATPVNKLAISLWLVAGNQYNFATVNCAQFTAATWYHIVMTYNATTRALVVRANDMASDTGTATADLRGASAADFIIAGRGDADANTFGGRMKQVGKWNRVLTASEITTLCSNMAGVTHPFPAIAYSNPKATHYTFEGDSMTYGDPSYIKSTLWTYPRQMLRLQSLPEQNHTNNAVGGSMWTDIFARAATVDASLNPVYARNILVVWAGFNGLRTDVVSVADTETYMANYCTARRAAGWSGANKIIVGTLTPSTAATTSANYEANRQLVNTWIRANYASWSDGVADFGADANIGVPGASDNTTYYNTDKIHPNIAGSGVIASIVNASVGAL